MSDHAITTKTNAFYESMNAEANYKTRVNHQNLPERINSIIKQLSKETMKRYDGSGIAVPENINGARILDIGCGTGSLVYILSKLVGPSGYVVGIDTCQGSIDLAKQESAYHMTVWGYDEPNFEFQVANAERLLELGLESFDVIVSNGVFCLLPDKEKAFQTAAALLKPGGQFYISDIYTEKPQSEEAKSVELLWFLGTTGSMVWSDFKEFVTKEGFTVPYLTQVSGIVYIENEEFRNLLNNARYACAAWRLFKLGPNAKRGPATVTYKGNIEDYEETFPWSVDLTFSRGKPVNVDASLASILANTSFKNNFDIEDFHGTIETKSNQNPFKRLDALASQGKTLKPIYSVE